MSTVQLQKYAGKILKNNSAKSELLITHNDDKNLSFGIYRRDYNNQYGFIHNTDVGSDDMIKWYNYTFNGENCAGKQHYIDQISAGKTIRINGYDLTIIGYREGYLLLWPHNSVASDNEYQPMTKEQIYERYIAKGIGEIIN